MNKFSNKNKIIIIIAVSIIFSFAVYFVYSKTDESTIFSYEDGIENNNIENNTKEESKIIKKEEKNKIVVYITGSVINEGIIELEENSRISNAIEKAGGLKDGADLSDINLAYVLSDGMKIHIPNLNEQNEKKEDKTSEYITKESGVSTITQTMEKNEKTNINVNINSADINQLSTLPGIGDSTAQKIIEYRKENGSFNSIEDIKNVKGIGDSKFEKIKDYITVK